jgi:hypothetical protein
MRGLRLCLFIPWMVSAYALAQTSPSSQTELNGFLLGQYAKASDGAFGKPTESRTTEDHWKYRAYVFDEKHRGYMAFKFPTDDSQRMLSIQIAGDAGTPMRPFLGLMLGDDKKKVQQALGAPESIEGEKDYDVDLYTYADRNYSVEINRQGKLSSIQVMGYAGFAEQPASSLPDVETLRKNVVHQDVDGLLSLLAGDLEIYRGDHSYDFVHSARAEIADQKSEIRRLLLGENGSLREGFTTERFEPDPQIRVYTEAPPGSVVKFPHSKIVEEIVFKIEAGTWKVWEIRLR